MDQYSDYLKKKHFPITRLISEKEFGEKKAQLSEDEFKQRYFIKNESLDYSEFYELVSYNPTDSEVTLFLLDELLTQQKISARKTRIIAGILIFWLVCDIITAILIFVNLSKII